MTQRRTDSDTSNFSTAWTVNNPPYAILKWSIENFSLADNLITSPCFEISQTSRWNLQMNPNVLDNEDAFIVFYLRRDTRRPGPARLMIRGEFSVHSPLEELIYDKLFEEVYDTSLNNTIEFRVAKICFRVRNSGNITLDTCLARCEMIISEARNSPVDFSLHLEKLSRDYKNFFDEGRYTDVTICGSDGVIRAHKAVLCSRSLALSEILETSENYISDNENSSLLAATLLFIYSGDPDLLLNCLPIETFGKVALIASRWRMNELRNIFTPARIHCNTVLKFKDFLYTWELINFSRLLRDSGGCIHSAEFTACGDTNTKWKMILEKNSGENSETYGLYVRKLLPGNVSHKIELEISMHKGQMNSTVATNKRLFTIGSRNVQKFGFSSLINNDYLQSEVLRNDTLYVDCRMKFWLDTESWITFQANLTDVCDEAPYSLKYLKTLSRNFKDLYISHNWSDLNIHANDEIHVVQAHRVVLCARSPYFSDMLSHTFQQDIYVPIGVNTLNEVLLYMYSAELPILNCQNCLNLYKACKLLRITELGPFCRQFILRNINVGNVLKFLEFAIENSDTELENESVHFVCIPGNARMIINTANWITFRIRYTDCAIRIYHELAEKYCNHVCVP